jgi:[protein-PII] uridylyltransferase
MRRPRALAAPASDAAARSRRGSTPAAPPPQASPRTDLICPAETIFPVEAVLQRIDDGIEALETRDHQQIRLEAVRGLLAARTEGMAVIEAAILARPLDSRAAVHSYACLTDGLVRAVFEVATRHLHPVRTAGTAEQMAVVAVGGYGRGEMAPYSDVDLLFLSPWKLTPWAESVVESMLYMLWDLRLKVGHASRTVGDCLRQGRDDYTIRTSMLECRFLIGHAPLAQELRDRLRTELFRNTASDFIEAKLAERASRHKKQGGQRYVVEPNVKEGKGGLRDLQSLYWIANYVHGTEDGADLVRLGVFTPEEHRIFLRAENFLWAVRNQLHLITGRAMDQLTFDLQVQVAERLGYADRGSRPAVELFMQDYFRHATRVGELTRILLTAMEADHIKRAPSLIGFFKRKKKLRDGFALIQNRITYASDTPFKTDRLDILRIFNEALRTGYLIHPAAMRLIVANLPLIDDEMRRAPEARRIFWDTLLKHGNPERALRRMNELGVLAAFIPEFQPIVAMMQFNMYHHYTVDEHTIQAVSTLARIERGEMAETLPFATRILQQGVDRKVLYMALFLHDIGKGRAEDHSVVGARIARRVAPRLGLKPQDASTVEWLVRQHLLMSDMAQKRDLSDPRTVRDFAKAVKTQKRLDLLTVLTACDIIAVGPGVWNNWKAVLIRNLYGQTSTALATGLEEVNREAREHEAKSALRAALSGWDRTKLRAETARHYGPYWQGLQTETHIVFACLLDKIPNDEIRIDLTADHDRDATRVCFAMSDHPGIFARLAGSLALIGANVVDARTYTTKDGYATSVFWVQDVEGAPYAANRLDRLREMIRKTLHGEVLPREAMVSRDKLKRRERAFRHPTKIHFDNEGSDIYTIIEVDTRDRTGLLYDLARTLSENNIYLATAQIATYGAQAVDTFYVKDMFGLKIMGQSRLERLERKLKDAIASGASKAASE